MRSCGCLDPRRARIARCNTRSRTASSCSTGQRLDPGAAHREDRMSDEPLTGKKGGRRGTNPRSLENLKRTRERLRTVPRSSNSPEHMERARRAKATKAAKKQACVDVAFAQTVEIAPVANGGIVAPVGQARSGNIGPSNARPGTAWPGQGRGDLPAPVSSSPSSPPKPETLVDVPVVKRSAPHWEVVCYPNGYPARRRIGSVEVVRVHVGTGTATGHGLRMCSLMSQSLIRCPDPLSPRPVQRT